MDWFDDSYWNIVENNIAALAKIAYMGGCEGIFFDTEEYSTEFWDWEELAAEYPSRPQDYASWRAKVKQRGQEFIEAVNSEFPGAKILMSFGPSAAWHGWPTSYIPDSVPDYPYEALVPPFVDGMLLGADADTEITDGFEHSYYHLQQSSFDNDINIVLEGCKSFSEHPVLYAEKLKAGLALYLTSSSNPFTPQEATDAVRRAMTTSDRYLWVWNERVTFWIQGGPGGTPLVPDWAMLNDPPDLTTPGTVDNAVWPDMSGMPQNMIDGITTGRNQALGQ